MGVRTTCRGILEWKNFFIVFLTPLVLSPLPILGGGSSVSRFFVHVSMLTLFAYCLRLILIVSMPRERGAQTLSEKVLSA